MTTHPSTVSDVDAIQRFAALCRHFGVVPRTEETRREGKADPVTDLFLSVKDTAAFVTAANAIRKETGWEKPDYLSAWERWPDLGHQSVATIKRRFDEIIALTRTENSNVPTFTHTSLWAHFAQQPTILAADFAKVDRKLADTAAILKATHEHAPISKADLWFAYLNAPVAFKRNPAVIATRLSAIYQRYLDGRFPCEGETPASAFRTFCTKGNLCTPMLRKDDAFAAWLSHREMDGVMLENRESRQAALARTKGTATPATISALCGYFNVDEVLLRQGKYADAEQTMNMFASVKNLPEFIKSTSAIRDHTNWTKEDFFDAWKTNSAFSEPTAARVIADKVAKISAASIIDNEPALKSNDVWNAFSRHPDAFRRPFEKMEAQVRSVTSAAGLDPNGKTILKDVDVWKMYMANPRLLQSGGAKIGERLQRIYKHFMGHQGHQQAAGKLRTIVRSGSMSLVKPEPDFAKWLSSGCKLRTGQGNAPVAENINMPREDTAQDRMEQLTRALGDGSEGKPVLTNADTKAIFARFPAEITFGDAETQIARFKTLQEGCARRLFVRKPRETAQAAFRRIWRSKLKIILLATDETFADWVEDQKATKPHPSAPSTAFHQSAVLQYMTPAEPPSDFVPWHRIGERVDFVGKRIPATPLQHAILKRFEDYGAHTLDNLADRLKGQTKPDGTPVTRSDVMESFQQLRGTIVQQTGSDFFKGTFRGKRAVTPVERPVHPGVRKI